MARKLFKNIIFPEIILIIFIYFSANAFAEEKRQIVVNGDKVEFFTEMKKVIAERNVIITYQDAKLTCDKVTVFSETNDVIAEGNVKLYTAKGNLEGEKLFYNFTKKTGKIVNANLQAIAPPFFGAGETIEKLSDRELEMSRAYLTTCDLEKPHYRLSARKLEIYPGERIVAKDVRFVVGRQTMFYLPQFTQVLNDKRPHVTVMPGYNKIWGAYLLQSWRYYFNENSRGLLHLDYREKRDFAGGIDYTYKIVNMGEGLIRTYYMNERNLQVKNSFQKRDVPTIEKERFKAEWRHKWEIDEKTNIILQYYKLKDSTFLKDYFRREAEKDEQPKSFFLLTKTFESANLSFDLEKRVNRFYSQTEKLPELKFDIFSQKIAETKFYYESQNTYGNISSKTAQPAGSDTKTKQTQKVDTFDKLSYQDKFAFIEANPYVAMRQTYFSRGADSNPRRNIIRGVFYTGVDLSTKFYRVFDVSTNYLELDINRLRHIITPTASYSYIHQPTVNSSQLSMDGIDRQHQLNLSLENKLQTKRGGNSVDLVRLIGSSNYLIKPKGYKFGRSHFSTVSADLEFTPYSWLRASADSSYNVLTRMISTVNFDIVAEGGDNWYVGFGRRYERKSANDITGEFAYRLNPKWKFRVYERFDSRRSVFEEQEYSIIRDLHCWEMEMNYNNTPGLGNTIWLIFRIKAFPEMGLEFENSFHGRKFGSQSSEGQ